MGSYALDTLVRRITTSTTIRPICVRFYDRRHDPLVLHAFRLNPHPCQSLYTGNNARRLSALSTSDLAAKLSHRPYLHENNHQTTDPLFPFLYNGFRISPENKPLAATLWQV